MNIKTNTRIVHICPECHGVFARTRIHHKRQTVRCEIGTPGDARSKPMYDIQGNLLTRAPVWWVEACKMKKKKLLQKKQG